MSKRKPIDKEQARERRNRLLDTAAVARLSITEGVREMRGISGMTQEEFARHRNVSARVIKSIELGQGNPTVATLNQIAGFFGLEVGFVPAKKTNIPSVESAPEVVTTAELSVMLEQVKLEIGRQVAEAVAGALANQGSDASVAPTRRRIRTQRP